MRLGLFALNYGTCADPDVAVEVAQRAEDAELESVWTGEHVVLPDPQPAGFSMPPTLPFLDTTVALTLVAASTQRIRIASGIYLLPFRNPVVFAKQLASLDVVAGGRLIVGVGAGYVPAELAATGVARAERWSRLDDCIHAMRALWTMERPRYSGPYVSFAGVNAFPRPVRPAGPPLVIGGHSRAALRRAVTLAQGWYGFALGARETEQVLHALRRVAAENERPPALGPLEITVTPIGPLDRGAVDRYAALGVDRLVVLPDPAAELGRRHRPAPRQRILQTIETLASL